MRKRDADRMRALMTKDPWDHIEGYRSRASMGLEMLEFFRSKVPEGSTIVELGSGKSTQWLAKYYDVYTVEDKSKFVGLVTGVHYIHAPLKSFTDNVLKREIKWYSQKALRDGLPEDYAALIVDGPDTDFGRYGLIHFYNSIFNNTPIMIDDMQQPFVYMTALALMRKQGKYSFEVRLTKAQRPYAWID